MQSLQKLHGIDRVGIVFPPRLLSFTEWNPGPVYNALDGIIVMQIGNDRVFVVVIFIIKLAYW